MLSAVSPCPETREIARAHVHLSTKSLAQAKDRPCQSHMPNKNLVVATTILVIITIFIC